MKPSDASATAVKRLDILEHLEPDAHGILEHLHALGVPLWTSRPAPPKDRREFRLPQGWPDLTPTHNGERLSHYAPGNAICGVCTPAWAFVDVDTKNGGEVAQVVGWLDSLGVAAWASVITPSGGRHFYITGPSVPSDYPGSNTQVWQGVGLRGVEVFGGRHFGYLPGTTRPKYDGKGYLVEWLAPERIGADAHPLWDALATAKTTRHLIPSNTPPSPPRTTRRASDKTRAEAYTRATVEALSTELAAVQPGTTGRNNALNVAAMKLAAKTDLSVDEVTNALMPACEANGLVADKGVASCRATIQSGFNHGHRTPQVTPANTPGAPAKDPFREFKPLESSQHAPQEGKPDAGGKNDATTRLIELAISRYKVACTLEGLPVGFPLEGHVVVPLKGERFTSELTLAFYERYGSVPPRSAVDATVSLLAARAYQTDPIRAHLRIAAAGGTVWIDMGDSGQHVIKVDADGWEICDTAPVAFRRTALTSELPTPSPGGDLSQLWGVLNVAPADRGLLLGWLVAALGFPDIPHPILTFTGEQGTGKSSATRLVSRLVDPSAVETHSAPTNRAEVFDAVSGSYVVGIDNVSSIRSAVSDELCRAVTGGGMSKRSLYTNDDKFVSVFRSALILNGINLGDLQTDLAERMLPVQLETIDAANRRTEAELHTTWAAIAPSVFGALLDLVSATLRTLPDVHLDTMPRMADFARILAALDLINGTSTAQGYAGKGEFMAEVAIASSDFIATVTERIRTPFTGTSKELCEAIVPDTLPRWWPSPRKATAELTKVAPALRQAGWMIEANTNRNTKVTQWHLEPPTPAGTTPAHPHPENTTPACVSPSQNLVAGVAGVAGVVLQESGIRELCPVCTVCGEPIDTPDGYTTHPDCDPNA